MSKLSFDIINLVLSVGTSILITRWFNINNTKISHSSQFLDTKEKICSYIL